MRRIFHWLAALSPIALASCNFIGGTEQEARDTVHIITVDTLKALADTSEFVRPDSAVLVIDTLRKDSLLLPGKTIQTKGVKPQQVVDFAKTLIGTPYVYASTDPKVGFDCSGFITYVFHHFDIIVPRSSIDFTHVGRDVSLEAAQPGDLILFTGTDSTERFVGHMGLVVSNGPKLEFIHSTSGKMHGVTITELNGYYMGRFMKTIRVFD